MKEFNVPGQNLCILMMGHQNHHRPAFDTLRSARQRGDCSEPSPIPIKWLFADPATQGRLKIWKLPDRLKERAGRTRRLHLRDLSGRLRRPTWNLRIRLPGLGSLFLFRSPFRIGFQG